MMDRSRKAALIQVYNPESKAKTLELIFEIEMYINFSSTFSKLSTPSKNIVSFVYHQRYFAFEFPDENQAKFFINAVKSIEDTEKSEKELK